MHDKHDPSVSVFKLKTLVLAYFSLQVLPQ